METLDCKTPQNIFCVTPTMAAAAAGGSAKFRFPPECSVIISSVERLKTRNYPVQIRSRRSFTPVRNSFPIESPQLSPIEFNNGTHSSKKNIVRLPPEKVSKVAADSTVSKTPIKSPHSGGFLTPLAPTRIRFASLNGSSTKKKREEAHQFKSSLTVYSNEDCKKRDGSFIEEDANVSQNALDRSARHGYLNHKLCIESILESNQLADLVPLFEKGQVEFESFLTLKETDLKRLGVEQKKDRTLIMRIIQDLN